MKKLQALEYLFCTDKRHIHAVAQAVIIDHGLAEEIVQEVFLKLWKHASLLERIVSKPPSQRRALLRKIVLNQSLDRLRVERRHALAATGLIDWITITSTWSQNTWCEALITHMHFREAVGHVPEIYRDPLVMWCEGYSIHETALILGRNPEAVKKQLQRGRTVLKKLL